LARPKPGKIDPRDVDVSSSTIRRIALHLGPYRAQAAAVFALLAASAA